MKTGTLRNKLFIRIAPTILITILVVGMFAFQSATKEINTVYDAQLISNGNVLWDLLTDEIQEAENAGNPKVINDIDLPGDRRSNSDNPADEYADSRMFRVWKDDKVLVYSDTALPKEVPMQKIGFSTVIYKGEEWRIYHLPTHERSSIEVGEKVALRDTLVSNILLNLAIPLILLIPVVNLLIWFGITSGIATVRILVQQILARSPEDLSPVDIKSLPHDLMPLGSSINLLLTKLQHSFTAERRFSDHAAHQLRTPLATLKLQLQMLAQSNDEQERDTLIKELLESSDRAAKLVGQLLTSTRLNSQAVTLHPFKIYPLVASVMAEFGPIATQKHIEMSLEGDEDITLRSDEMLIRLMLANIIENAVKYTPREGKLKVQITLQEAELLISATDNGPGIPQEVRELVFERFYRGNVPQIEGSGLGLAIVAEIIDRLSGRIELKTPPSGEGLLVEITLPVT